MPVFYLVILLGSAFLMSGAYKAAFKQMRGGRIAIGDLFSGGDVFLRVAGGVLLTAILAGIGAVFCILPAFAVAGLLYFTTPLIIEKQLGVIDAMRQVFNRTKGHWFMFTLFAIVVGILAQLGSVACGIGMLATFPLLFTINSVAFRDLFGVSGAQSFAQQQLIQLDTHSHGPHQISRRPQPDSVHDVVRLGSLPVQGSAMSAVPISSGDCFLRYVGFLSTHPARNRIMIEFDNVEHRYPNGNRVLDGVSFKIETGEVLVMVGRSGSGKTTIPQAH
jgi:ABC-type multidrug transport system fused ATPase/permease subunit